MAFVATPVRTLGLGGSMKLEVGTWYGEDGDADGSLTRKGGRVYGAQFMINDSDVSWDAVPVTFSVSGGNLTITVSNVQTVESGYGTYFILYE
jgi:hypothetical protein